MLRSCILFFCLFLSLSAFSQNRDLLSPLDIQNQYLFYLPFLNMPLEKASTLKKYGQKLKFSIYKSSTFIDNYQMNYLGLVDAETTTISFQYLIGLGNNWEFKVVLPYIYQGGGQMDGLIEGFHHLFGLPNGGREQWDNGSIRIQWNPNGTRVTNAVHALADPSFYIKKILYQKKLALSLSFAYKPSLQNKFLVHSGTHDFGFSLNGDYFYKKYYFFAGIGASILLGKSNLEALDYEYPFIIHAGLGVGRLVSKQVAVFTQFYVQSSPYNSGVTRIDRVSLVHSLGLKWFISSTYLLQFSADEDTFTYSTTDIAFKLQMEAKF